jgi:uncharacterized protein (TIGR02145 family)
LKNIIYFMRKFLPLIAFVFVCQANAQNYLVTFTGTGESAVVNKVNVENLTTGATLTLNGNDILRLTLPTGIDDVMNGHSSELRFFPNPMTDYSIFKFRAPAEGNAVISIYDITGKPIFLETDYLGNLEYEFRLSGLKNGLYIVNIRGDKYQFSGKLISDGSNNGKMKIEKISSYAGQIKETSLINEAKGNQATIDMPYNTGQWLKFTGVSGDFTTIVTSVFNQDKQVNFNFISCKDGDNINYPVVEIGSQVWMALNLRTTKYRNGDVIGTTIPKTLNITAETSPKYEWVYYGYEIQIDTASYGRLYTWHAATDSRSLCPTGWHLPLQTEWNTLFTTLGGASVAGGKIKETGLTHWASPNTGATNESGFTVLPNGSRAPAGSCANYTKFSYLWSATEKDNNYAWYSAASYDSGYSYSDINTGKNVGLGIRCVKD